VPAGLQALSVSATATDNLGRSSTASAVYNVVTDPLTTLHGTVVDVNGVPVTGAAVRVETGGLKAEFFHVDPPVVGFPDLSGRTPRRGGVPPRRRAPRRGGRLAHRRRSLRHRHLRRRAPLPPRDSLLGAARAERERELHLRPRRHRRRAAARRRHAVPGGAGD